MAIHFIKDLSEIIENTLASDLTLVADSGGTKTDWCLISDESAYIIETVSLHPNHLISISEIAFLKLLKQIASQKNIEFHFFGAGCLQPNNQEIIRNYFATIPFKFISVQSDLIGAGKALLSNTSGLIGIMGTGSVLCYFDGNTITKLVGGFGYLLGDEGSGYYFGKLMIHHYLSNKCSKALQQLIENTLGSREEILAKVYSSEGKKIISSILLLTNDVMIQEEINAIHKLNINLFLDSYLPKETYNRSISFIGSYAYFHENILQELLTQRGWKLEKCIQKPIIPLTENIIHRKIS